MKNPVTRRQFLENGTMAAGAAAVTAALGGCGTAGTGMTFGPAPATRVSRRTVSPNEKFNITLVGCGGMGRYKLGNFMDSKQCNVVALCDVDDKQLAGAAEDAAKKLNQKPELIKDYRQVVTRKDIDLVIVATPDHWHAAPMMLAVASGKDVYCEKPCCHNIHEGRLMVNAAKKYGAVVQVGTHQREIPHIQEAREFIRAGKLGTISMTNTYTYGNEVFANMGNDPDGPVPPGVNYDMWLGAARVLPFNKRRFHNTWRWYFDYGCGMVGDWNVHLQDIIMWTMGAVSPISVSCVGGHFIIEDDRTTPDMMQAVYEFPAPQDAPTSKQGFIQTYTMRKVSGKPWDVGGYGMDFHGTNGMIHLTRNDYVTDPDKWDWKFWDGVKKQGRIGPNQSEWRTGNMTKEQKNRNFPGADQAAHQKHVEDFLACVRDRKPPLANLESHYYSVAACHLANVSLRVGRRVYWDGTRELCFTDRELRIPDREANKYLAREYRKGFELPVV
ncbi:MAG TPA: Gfo/Idh/MocA family oxidoreductase [Phycisphaerae bacterium]|nr:Gfo/Idh/MocA family oxidoreductase [Phycisphaerae bacterium]HRY70730.1 Gfo/Idh/MocA family oxidoreductase [Phycisphaerae bacterium]HSA28764.1 Gfo/Idh/MocA family oxidoreductase [Phycisphaerae bacterium]